MATSGTATWTLNRAQVIKGALRKLGVLPSGGSPTANQTSDAAEALNGLVKALHAKGMPLWKITSATFTVTSGTSSYTVGPSQTVNTATPLRVIQAFYTPSGGNNTPLNVYNRYDFNDLPMTNTEGTPVNFYYQPLRTTGVVKLWPTPSDSTTEITFHYEAPFEDMSSDSDDFDFPSYWITALIYNLAWLMAPEFGMPINDRSMLAQEAKYWTDEALSIGTEEGSLFLAPNTEY
jgi:hypothetical protein